MLQPCLFIGGNDDGLTHPIPDGAESVQWPVGITGRETYSRLALSLGEAAVDVFVHESLAPEEVLNCLIDCYKAWAINRQGGRL